MAESLATPAQIADSGRKTQRMVITRVPTSGILSVTGRKNEAAVKRAIMC